MADPAIPIVEVSDPTAVYRLYDRSDVLLYVGITSNMSTRFRAHGVDKSWWPQVARKTMSLYGSREEAEAEEARAILAENPRHNIVRYTAKAPKRTAPSRKPAPAARQQPAMPPRTLPRHYSFTLDGVFQAKIDAYCQLSGQDRDAAITVLILMGLAWFGDDENAEATRKQLAALGGFIPLEDAVSAI